MKTKTKLTIICSIFLEALTMSQWSLAKAAYSGKAEMIENSEIIALVDINKVEKVAQKGTNWTYSQKALAAVESALKGKPGKKIEIFGGEDFICASCKFEPGRYLVFLNHNRDMLIGSNWHLSIRPIQNNSLEWYDGENMQPLKAQPLNTVLTQIKEQLPRPIKLEGPILKLFQAQTLDDDVVGEGGKSEVAAAYREALPLAAKQPKELTYLCTAGTPAGRIYGAMLRYHADKEAGKQALLRLTRCNGTVCYRSGCERSCEGVWNVSEKLYSSGKFDGLKLEN
ncbi:MAG: hypothetical protein JST01_25945 [Cyanobacteria bacterium SZAS TMP-1]|nr:hypothetical protein [Cyanobacteria bacterium SZAS TMP-1]